METIERKANWIRSLATLLTGVILSNTALAYAPETNLWKERAASIKASAQQEKNEQYAQLPGQFMDANPAQILKRLPPVASYSNSSALASQISSGLSTSQIQLLAPILRSIPGTYGSVRKISAPANSAPSKVVIHIQDVHLNAEAQNNISRTLKSLIDEGRIGLIALEGDSGNIPLQTFKSYPYQEDVHSVADYLLKENGISGPIHAALLTDHKIPAIVGIDDKTHYQANIDAYKRSSESIGKTKKDLAKFESALNKEKASTFGKELIDFDREVEGFRANQIQMGDHIRFLSKRGMDLSFNTQIFLEALKMESSINFSQVESERTRLISAFVQKLDKTRTDELLAISLAYRLGRLKHTEFYKYLRDLCSQTGIALTQYRAMDAYIQYVLLADSINAEKLFADSRQMENDAYASLVTSAPEKALINESRGLYLAKRLVEFGLTKEEWQEYKAKSTIKPHVPELAAFEMFYDEAEIRDHAMSDNFLKAMDKAGAQTAVLVTGGFHSSGMNARFKEAGLTTLTFIPKITAVADETGTAYLSVFAQEKTPLDKLFEGEKLFLATDPNGGLPAGAGTIVGKSLTSHPDANPQNLFNSLMPGLAGSIKIQIVVKAKNLFDVILVKGGSMVRSVVRLADNGKINSVTVVPSFSFTSPKTVFTFLAVMMAGVVSAQAGTGDVSSTASSFSGLLVAGVGALLFYPKQIGAYATSVFDSIRGIFKTANPFKVAFSATPKERSKPLKVQLKEAVNSLVFARGSGLQVIFLGLFFVSLALALPAFADVLLSKVAPGMSSAASLNLNAWAFYLKFVGSVMVLLTGIIFSARLVWEKPAVKNFLNKTINIDERIAAHHAYEERTKEIKGKNWFHGKAREVRVLHWTIVKTLYGFGFRDSDNFTKIFLGKKTGPKTVVESIFASKLISSVPLVQLMLLVFVSAVTIIVKRLKLLALSTLSRSVITFLAFGVAGVSVAVASSLGFDVDSSVSWVSWFMNLNIADLFMGSGYAHSVIQSGGISGALIGALSPFAVLNSYVLTLIFLWFARANQMRGAGFKEFIFSYGRSLSEFRYLLRVPVMDEQGGLKGYRPSIYMSAVSAFGLEGVHWVSAEIELAKAAAHFTPVTNEVITKIEGHEGSVLSAGNELMQTAGINLDGIPSHFWFNSANATESQILSVEPLMYAAKNGAEQAKKLGQDLSRVTNDRNSANKELWITTLKNESRLAGYQLKALKARQGDSSDASYLKLEKDLIARQNSMNSLLANLQNGKTGQALTTEQVAVMRGVQYTIDNRAQSARQQLAQMEMKTDPLKYAKKLSPKIQQQLVAMGLNDSQIARVTPALLENPGSLDLVAKQTGANGIGVSPRAPPTLGETLTKALESRTSLPFFFPASAQNTTNNLITDFSKMPTYDFGPSAANNEPAQYAPTLPKWAGVHSAEPLAAVYADFNKYEGQGLNRYQWKGIDVYGTEQTRPEYKEFDAAVYELQRFQEVNGENGHLGMLVGMEKDNRWIPLTNIDSYDQILEWEKAGRIKLYEFPALGENPALGRGKEVTNPGEYEEKNIALQVWLARVESDGKTLKRDPKTGQVIMDRIIFGDKMANLREKMAESSLESRKTLIGIYERSSKQPDNSKDKKNKVLPIVGSIAAKNQFLHISKDNVRDIKLNDVVKMDSALKDLAKKTGTVDAKTAKKANTKSSNPQWSYVTLADGSLTPLVFARYENNKLVEHTQRDLDGNNKDKKKIERIFVNMKNGRPLSEAELLTTPLEQRDEVFFGENAIRQDLAKALLGWVDFRQNIENAKKYRSTLRVGVVAESLVLGFNLSGVPYGALGTRGAMAIWRVAAGKLPGRLTDAKIKIFMTDFMAQQTAKESTEDAQWGLGDIKEATTPKAKEEAARKHLKKITKAEPTPEQINGYIKLAEMPEVDQTVILYVQALLKEQGGTDQQKMAQELLTRVYMDPELKRIKKLSGQRQAQEILIYLLQVADLSLRIRDEIAYRALEGQEFTSYSQVFIPGIGYVTIGNVQSKQSVFKAWAPQKFTLPGEVLLSGFMSDYLEKTTGLSLAVTGNYTSQLLDFLRGDPRSKEQLTLDGNGILKGDAFQFYAWGFPTKIFMELHSVNKWIEESKGYAIAIDPPKSIFKNPLSAIGNAMGFVGTGYTGLTKEQLDLIELRPVGTILNSKSKTMSTLVAFKVEDASALGEAGKKLKGQWVVFGEEALKEQSGKLYRDWQDFKEYQQQLHDGGVKLEEKDGTGAIDRKIADILQKLQAEKDAQKGNRGLIGGSAAKGAELLTSFQTRAIKADKAKITALENELAKAKDEKQKLERTHYEMGEDAYKKWKKIYGDIEVTGENSRYKLESKITRDGRFIVTEKATGLVKTITLSYSESQLQEEIVKFVGAAEAAAAHYKVVENGGVIIIGKDNKNRFLPGEKAQQDAIAYVEKRDYAERKKIIDDHWRYKTPDGETHIVIFRAGSFNRTEGPNQFNGEFEKRTYENGLLTRVELPNLITINRYEEHGIKTDSETYVKLPNGQRGRLLFKTKTIEAVFPAKANGELDHDRVETTEKVTYDNGAEEEHVYRGFPGASEIRTKERITKITYSQKTGQEESSQTIDRATGMVVKSSRSAFDKSTNRTTKEIIYSTEFSPTGEQKVVVETWEEATPEKTGRRLLTVHTRDGISEQVETHSEHIFNPFSGLWVPRMTVLTVDGFKTQERAMEGIVPSSYFDAEGRVTFKVTSYRPKLGILSGILPAFMQEGNVVDVVKETIGRRGSLVRSYKETKQELTEYDESLGDEIFQKTDIRFHVPKETWKTNSAGEKTLNLYEHAKPELVYKNGRLEKVILSRENQVFKGEKRTDTYELGIWNHAWGNQIVGVSGIRLVEQTIEKADGKTIVRYSYSDKGFQVGSISEEYTKEGALILDATRRSKVLLDSAGFPILEKISLKGISSPSSEEISVTTVEIETSLGEVYQDQIDPSGRPVRRFLGHSTGENYIPPTILNGVVIPGGRVGGFVRDQAMEIGYSRIGVNPEIDQYQLKLDDPIQIESVIYKTEPNGDYIGEKVERSRYVSTRVNPENGELEFTYEHESFVDNGKVVNNVWRNVQNRQGYLLGHYDGYRKGNRFVPVMLLEYQYGSIHPGVPTKSVSYKTDENGQKIPPPVSESETLKDNPIRRPGEVLFGTTLPVAVVVSQGFEPGTGKVWQEARDLSGRVRVIVEGTKGADGKFNPILKFVWKYGGTGVVREVENLRHVNVPTEVTSSYLSGFTTKEEVLISSGKFIGMEALPTGFGFLGEQGVLSETQNHFTGSAIRELRDARGFIAVRRDGYMKLNEETNKFEFHQLREATYDYMNDGSRPDLPYGTAFRITARQDGRVVRVLEFSGIDEGYLKYKVIHDRLEFGLEFVGYGPNGDSFEDHIYREAPKQVRIYSRQAIPLYSVTPEYHGKRTLFKVYDSRVVILDKNTYVVTQQREPEFAPRGNIRNFISKYFQGLDDDANLSDLLKRNSIGVLRGPIWGVIRNGQVIYREEGRYKIIRDELTTWSLEDHLLASPAGGLVRLMGYEPGKWAHQIRNIALGRETAPNATVHHFDRPGLIPDRYKRTLTPEEQKEFSKAERWYYFKTIFLLPIAFVTFFVGSVVLARLVKWGWWKSRGVIAFNTATKEEFENLKGFRDRYAIQLLDIRRQEVVIRSFEELEDILTKRKMNDLLVLVRANRKKLQFTMDPVVGNDGLDARVNADDIEYMKNLHQDLWSNRTSGFSSSALLAPIASQINDFLDRKFLSHAQLRSVISKYVDAITPGVMLRSQVSAHILADITRDAYRQSSRTSGDKLNPTVQSAFKERISSLVAQMGMSNDPQIEEFIDLILTEQAGMGVNAEFAFIEPVDRKKLGNIESGLKVIENRLGVWRLVPLEEMVIKKLIRRAIPFISTQAPYENYLTARVLDFIRNDRGSEVPQLLETHRAFFYRLMKRELDDKLEKMRDFRTGVKWDYAFTWEEFSDFFRYMHDRKSEWGDLPVEWTEAENVAAAAVEMTRLDPKGDLGSRIVGSEKDKSGKYNAASISDAELDDMIKKTFEPLVKNMRARLNISKVEKPQNQALFVFRPFFLLLTNPSYWQRFLGDSRTGKSLQARVATAFWFSVGFGTFLFALYLGYFVLTSLSLVPVMMQLNLAGFNITLSGFWRAVILLGTLLPLGDALPLTYFSFANVGKFVMAITFGRFYRISTVKTWGRWHDIDQYFGSPTVRSSLPELLQDEIKLKEFEKLIQKMRESQDLTDKEYKHWTSIFEDLRSGGVSVVEEKTDVFVVAPSKINITRWDIPRKLSVRKSEERIKSWVNKQYRLDSPDAPTKPDQVKSFTFQISGWAEDFYLDWDKLLLVDEKKGELQHRLGLAAQSYFDRWSIFVEDLYVAGKIDKAQRKVLLSLKSNPDLALDKELDSNVLSTDVKDEISEWANDTLMTGYHHLKGALQAREVYADLFRKMFPQAIKSEIDRMVDEKLQFIMKHDKTGLAIDTALNGGLDELLGRLRKDPEIKGDVVLGLGLNPGKTFNDLLHSIATGKTSVETMDEKRLSEKELEIYLRFIAKNKIDLHWWKKGRTDVHEGAKYTQWANLLPHVRGEITFALDWDHEHLWEEISKLPEVGREFDVDPTLSLAVYKGYIPTKPITILGKAMGMAEEGWLAHELRVKDKMGAVGFYGKGFIRTQFMRDLEALQDEYVAEDIETALRFMSMGLPLSDISRLLNIPVATLESMPGLLGVTGTGKGMSTKHIGYMSVGKGLPTDYSAALSPLRKWSGDAGEALMGATPQKFLLNPNVHWTKKWDTIVSFSFYLKKNRVVRYITWLAFMHYAFPFNPLTGLVLIFYVAAVFLGQAISYGAWLNRVDERGWIKGTFVFAWDLVFVLGPFFMGMLPHYADATNKGFQKYAKFISTLGKSGPSRRASFTEVYINNSSGLRLGAGVAWLTVVLSPFDPARTIIWIAVLGAVVYGWFMSPFFFNPGLSIRQARNKHGYWSFYFFWDLKYIGNTLQMFVGFFYALWDIVLTILVVFAIPIDHIFNTHYLSNILHEDRIWEKLRAYSTYKEKGKEKDKPALNDALVKEINSLARDHFNGLKSLTEGRSKNVPSRVYLRWMKKLVKRAEDDLKASKVPYPVLINVPFELEDINLEGLKNYLKTPAGQDKAVLEMFNESSQSVDDLTAIEAVNLLNRFLKMRQMPLLITTPVNLSDKHNRWRSYLTEGLNLTKDESIELNKVILKELYPNIFTDRPFIEPIKHIEESRPALPFVILNSLPLADWLVLFVPRVVELPKSLQNVFFKLLDWQVGYEARLFKILPRKRTLHQRWLIDYALSRWVLKSIGSLILVPFVVLYLLYLPVFGLLLSVKLVQRVLEYHRYRLAQLVPVLATPRGPTQMNSGVGLIGIILTISIFMTSTSFAYAANGASTASSGIWALVAALFIGGALLAYQIRQKRIGAPRKLPRPIIQPMTLNPTEPVQFVPDPNYVFVTADKAHSSQSWKPVRELVGGKKVMFVEPHPDDIAISAGGFVRQVVDMAKDVKLVTVIPDHQGVRDEYIRNAGFGKPETPEAREKIKASIREDETHNYLNAIGLSRLDSINIGMQVKHKQPKSYYDLPLPSDYYQLVMSNVSAHADAEVWFVPYQFKGQHHDHHSAVTEAYLNALASIGFKGKVVFYETFELETDFENEKVETNLVYGFGEKERGDKQSDILLYLSQTDRVDDQIANGKKSRKPYYVEISHRNENSAKTEQVKISKQAGVSKFKYAERFLVGTVELLNEKKAKANFQSPPAVENISLNRAMRSSELQTILANVDGAQLDLNVGHVTAVLGQAIQKNKSLRAELGKLSVNQLRVFVQERILSLSDKMTFYLAMRTTRVPTSGGTVVVLSESLAEQEVAAVMEEIGRASDESHPSIIIARSNEQMNSLLPFLSGRKNIDIVLAPEGVFSAAGSGENVFVLQEFKNKILDTHPMMSKFPVSRFITPLGMGIDPTGVENTSLALARFILLNQLIASVVIEIQQIQNIDRIARYIKQQA